MNLPTPSQVRAVALNVTAGLGFAVGLFGLAGKVDLNQLTELVKATGEAVSAVITVIGLATPFATAAWAWYKTSRAQQVKSVTAVKGTTVVLPEDEAALAHSIPGPSVVAATDVKVVPK